MALSAVNTLGVRASNLFTCYRPGVARPAVLSHEDWVRDHGRRVVEQAITCSKVLPQSLKGVFGEEFVVFGIHVALPATPEFAASLRDIVGNRRGKPHFSKLDARSSMTSNATGPKWPMRNDRWSTVERPTRCTNVRRSLRRRLRIGHRPFRAVCRRL